MGIGTNQIKGVGLMNKQGCILGNPRESHIGAKCIILCLILIYPKRNSCVCTSVLNLSRSMQEAIITR